MKMLMLQKQNNSQMKIDLGNLLKNRFFDYLYGKHIFYSLIGVPLSRIDQTFR